MNFYKEEKKYVDFNKYTNKEIVFNNENKKLWKTYLQNKKRFIKGHRQFISENYISGFEALNFNADKIPTLEELNLLLNPTGWQVVYVDGYLSQVYYGKLLSQKITPISKQIRSLAHIDYAPAPDMLHDIFGHLPMLFSKEYSNLLVCLGEIMSRISPNLFEKQLYHLKLQLSQAHEKFGNRHCQTKKIEKRINQIEIKLQETPALYTLLGNFYIWTIEFGVLKTCKNIFQIYGAGLISSKEESEKFCKGQTKLMPFTLASTKVPYYFSSFQDQLFYTPTFDYLKDVLNRLT